MIFKHNLSQALHKYVAEMLEILNNAVTGICYLYNKVHYSLQNIKLALTNRPKLMHC